MEFGKILKSDAVYKHLSEMLESATESATLVSPYISIDLLAQILEKIRDEVHVTVITKWNPVDLVNGFNDLNVASVLEERGNSELRLLINLHAKYYRADNDVIFGSGNLTYSGLNANKSGNTEIMVQVDRSFLGLADFEDALRRKSVIPRQGLLAEIQQEMELLHQSKVIQAPIRDFGRDQIVASNQDWVPICQTPDALFEIYQKNTTELAFEVVNSGRNDLIFFDPPGQMDKRQFEAFLRIGVSQSSLFSQSLEVIKNEDSIDDARGTEIVRSLYPSMSDEDIYRSWLAARRWLAYFFPKQFVIAGNKWSPITERIG